jgi:hypothetical protein
MEKHFMIDIESTGIDPKKEDLLQVGVLELTFQEGFWKPGRSLQIEQHTFREPASEFAKKHQVSLYEKCRRQRWLPPGEIRDRMLEFFRSCGTEPPDVYLMGWNASNFDVPFLVHHGFLRPSEYVTGPDGKDQRVGDYHYRIYEIGGAVSLVQNALQYDDRKKLIEDAREAFPMEIPPGQEHEALFDCYRQTQLLNGLIRISRHQELFKRRIS